MAQGNKVVKIYRREKNWKREETTPTLVGSFDAYVEERIGFSRFAPFTGGVQGVAEIGTSLCIIFKDVDLTNCYLSYDGRVFEIKGYDRFWDDVTLKFSHMEITYA